MMKPSFLFIDTYYPAFLEYFYNKNKEIVNKSYNEQKTALMTKYFGISGLYSSNLIKVGCQAQEIIANDELLQKQWAREKGINFNTSFNFHPARRSSFWNKFFQKRPQLYYWLKGIVNKKSWAYQILMARIKEYRPDILYVLDIGFLSPTFLKETKRYVKIVVGQIACPVPPDKNFIPYDLIISSLPHYVEKFRKMGIKSEFLKLGFEASALSKLKKTAEQYSVIHIGGYGPIHKERNEILEKLAQGVDIKFWGYGTNFLRKNSLILKNYIGESWGLDRYNIFYNSKIIVNKHISAVAQSFANNGTLYEATGTGAMLITDYKDNLGEIFKIGKEVETYNSAEELAEKVKYYLFHNEKREKIAKAGQERTLKDHTYKVRTKELLNILEKNYDEFYL